MRQVEQGANPSSVSPIEACALARPVQIQHIPQALSLPVMMCAASELPPAAVRNKRILKLITIIAHDNDASASALLP